MNVPQKADVRYRLLLYTADDTHNSMVAVANLRTLCEAHLPGRHEIEVVDVLKHPERALADHITMTPTLIRLAPPPLLRIVGTLSQQNRALQALGVEPEAK